MKNLIDVNKKVKWCTIRGVYAVAYKKSQIRTSVCLTLLWKKL